MALRTIYIALVCFLSSGLSAQVTFDSDSLVQTDNNRSIVQVTGSATNTSNSDIDIVWERVINDFPAGWSGSQICDATTCWTFSVSSKTFTAPADSTVNLYVDFHIDSIPGNGHVRLKVYQLRDSANTVEYVEYYVEVSEAVTSVEPLSFPSGDPVRMYPNPVTDFLTVEKLIEYQIDRIEVYNMLGRKVREHRFRNNEVATKIDLYDLQRGIYMIRVFDPSNNVLLTKSISKSH